MRLSIAALQLVFPYLPHPPTRKASVSLCNDANPFYFLWQPPLIARPTLEPCLLYVQQLSDYSNALTGSPNGPLNLQ